MGEFFKGWRRKTGCVTLVMACVLAVMWIRNTVASDLFLVGQVSIHFSRGGIVWSIDDVSMWHWGSWEHLPKDWNANGTNLYFGNNMAVVPYRCIVLPLTILSAHLILWNPRKRERLVNSGEQKI